MPALEMPDPLGVDTTLEQRDQNAILGPGNTVATGDSLAQPTMDQSSLQDAAQGSSTDAPAPTGVSSTRSGVVAYARRFLGDPYVWGGTRPGGFDCSGLVQYVLSKAGGISLPRISAQQANFGKRVGYDQLQAGDLVAWDNSSRNNGADHIAIYIGNGYIIEAPRAGVNVRVRYVGKDLGGGWGVKLKYSGESTSVRAI